MQNQQVTSQIVLILIIVVVFYFFLIRPQMRRQKQRSELIASIRKGDEVITVGGLIGRITQMDDDIIMLEVSKDVTIKMSKSSVAKKITKEEL
ncbi:MAG: preprotein translocase subunit YajC [Actinobacteria bacterium]|nr:MAG: preprotein translocase subunit YajC [Actinomycetota bacterium]